MTYLWVHEDGISPGTVAGYLTHIRNFYKDCQLEIPRDDKGGAKRLLVRDFRKGLQDSLHWKPGRVKKFLMRAEHITRMLFNLSSCTNDLMVALAVVGTYCGFGRLTCMAPPSQGYASKHPHSVVRWERLSWHQWEGRTLCECTKEESNFTIIDISERKNRIIGPGTPIACPETGTAMSVPILARMLHAKVHPKPQDPIFCWDGDKTQLLTSGTLLNILRAELLGQGYPLSELHHISIRRGASQDGHDIGRSDDDLAWLGDWSLASKKNTSQQRYRTVHLLRMARWVKEQIVAHTKELHTGIKSAGRLVNSRRARTEGTSRGSQLTLGSVPAPQRTAPALPASHTVVRTSSVPRRVRCKSQSI